MLLFVLGMAGQSWVRILNFALLYVMLPLGLNIVVGFAGLLDGYIAFYAVGAYTWRCWPRRTSAWYLPFWAILLIALAVACLFGVLLRGRRRLLRGDYLAIVTLGFGEIIRIFLNNLNAPVAIPAQRSARHQPHLHLQRWASLPRPHREPAWHARTGRRSTTGLLLALTLIIILVCVRLQNSRIGRAWEAIREDEIAAKAMGINTRNIKLLAFAMGGLLGGGRAVRLDAGLCQPGEFLADERPRSCAWWCWAAWATSRA